MAPLLQKAGLLSDEVALHIEPLTVLMLRKYGPVFIQWEPETLFERLEADFGPVGVVAADRVGASQVLSAHDAAWKEWDVFENIAAVAQGVPAVFGQMQPPDVEFAAIGVTVLAAFGPREYHDDVRGYIAACCLQSGLWHLEAPLDFCADLAQSFYQTRGFSPPVEELLRRLKTQTEYIPQPSGLVEVQVNQVLSVRKAVAEYKQQVESQLRSIQ